MPDDDEFAAPTPVMLRNPQLQRGLWGRFPNEFQCISMGLGESDERSLEYREEPSQRPFIIDWDCKSVNGTTCICGKSS